MQSRTGDLTRTSAAVFLVSVLTIVLATAAAAEWPEPKSNAHLQPRHGLGTSGIALLPAFAYEHTTLAQDALIERARQLAGDNREHDALLACELLKNDPTAHPDLRRWAALERITLLCYSFREWEAVVEAERWLEHHPDDPNALGIKYTVARILAQRRHGNFQPTREEFWAAMNQLLAEHGEETHPLVVEAYLFARGQVRYNEPTPYTERDYTEWALQAALRVEQDAHERGDEALSERMAQVRAERIEPWLDDAWLKRRAAEGLAKQMASPSFQEYVERLYDHAEETGAEMIGDPLQPLHDFIESALAHE